MPDYNKLTVVKLREELVKRGLSKIGLKPVLVSRLLEADAQTEIQDATPVASTPDGSPVTEESHTQVEPSSPSQTHHAQDREGEDQQSTPTVIPEPKITAHTENGSSPERKPLVISPGILRENERSLDVPGQLKVQPPATVQEDTVVERVPPGIGAFLVPQLQNDAHGADLSGAELTDTVATEPAPPTDEVLQEIRSRNQTSDQTQEPIHTAAISQPPELRSLKQAAAVPVGIIAPQSDVENEPFPTPSEQRPSEHVLEEAVQAFQPDKHPHTANIPDNKETVPAESIKVVEATQRTTASNDSSKNIEGVQAQDSITQPDVDEKSTSGSTLQDGEAKPSITGAEALEDNKKRKRRSQSPPLLTQDIAQKRARMDDSKLSVILPEDSPMRDLADNEGKESEDISMTDPIPNQLPDNDPKDSHTLSEDSSMRDLADSEGKEPEDISMTDPVPNQPSDNDDKDSHTLPADSPVRDLADSESKESEDISKTDPVPNQPSDNDDKGSHTQFSEKDIPHDENSNPTEENAALQPQVSAQEPKSPRENELQPNAGDQNPIQTRNEDIAGKLSPHDTRFKKLFGGPPNRSGSPDRQAAYRDTEDRSVGPALHLATCALYIRNFMRPLHPSHLKDHLIALATPETPSPSASPLSQIITEFFLDPIRTHCLVGFTSTAAASRVRSNLHNRVWPDERTRRPLWIDFVPAEKLQKWIEVEKDVGSQRSQGAKRWEVVYEDEDGHIKAYLQEASPGSGPPSSHPSTRPKHEALHAPPGVTGAPLGPRTRAIEAPRPGLQQKQALGQQGDVGKGFQALDDLFQSTTAKPKLYYLPVRKAVADKRLEQLEDGRWGGRSGNEIRKYTFEGEILVDRGAEFGGRPRGGYGGWTRGRGGGNGGGGGGGGGYRGESWRERDRQRGPYDARERDEGLRERARREAWREKDHGDTFRERERDRPGAWRERDRDGGWRGVR